MEAIPYGKQSISDEDIEAVTRTLRSDFLTQGPIVTQFEEELAKFNGCRYATAVTNGTAALHLSVMALGLKPGDKVLCTTNSFVASANCILYCGGEVEFIDINPDDFCISTSHIKKILSKSPQGTYKGIIAVDFAGHPAKLEEISQIAKEHTLWLIEDACHSIGAEYQARDGNFYKTGNGNFADLTVYSFHPVKHLATGEGGMITTNRKKLHNKLQRLRSHGITKDTDLFYKKSHGPWYYEMQELGFNYRISDILCSLGLSQLKRLNSNIERRREIANYYNKNLTIEVTKPTTKPNIKHAYHLYIIQTPKRDELYNYLKEKGIHCQVHYIPIHTQPYYIKKYGKIKLENAESYYSKALSLPMFHSLSDSELERVVSEVNSFFEL